MTQHEDLPLYNVEYCEKSLYLTHPNGESVSIKKDVNHQDKLSEWFSHYDLGLSKSSSNTAYWDHNDAHISIINISTVNSIAKTAGIDIDPQRFRGNLLIETEKPWLEFSLIGQRICIGSVELEILRPIDRCKATSVNPSTGAPDINVPHLLSSQYGHVFCGIYARVVKPGKIEKDDEICVLSPAPNAINDGARTNTAPSPEQWPRFIRLVKRVKESHNVESFWFEDPLSNVVGNIEPASYLRLHVKGENGPLIRSYTISKHNSDAGLLRLSIKKETGEATFSPWIHSSLQVGDTLLASGPFVDPSMTWRPSLMPQKELLIITAGIGITVATSIITSLKNAAYTSKVNIIHSIKYDKDSALWGELLEDICQLENVTSCLFVTQEHDFTQTTDKRSGRINISIVTKNLTLDNTQVFLCGPPSFSQSMRDALIQKGVSNEAIHQDVFYSPQSIAEGQYENPIHKEPSLTVPTPISFVHASGETSDIIWKPEHGTLLNAAEQSGIHISANCRSGACRSCLYRIVGEIENIIPPVSLAPKNWTYLCCAAPLSSVTIKEKANHS
jgi:ferredoxin-NADP reductase/MOSC domain-containing protein YiiM